MTKRWRQLDTLSMTRDLIELEVNEFARKHADFDAMSLLMAEYIRRGYDLKESYRLAKMARKFFKRNPP